MKEVKDMDRSIPGPGEMYIDQEGKPFQVICVAEHFDTMEKMVVYQELSGAFAFLTRPLGIFMRRMERKGSFTAVRREPPVASERQKDFDAGNPQRERECAQADKTPREYRSREEEQADPALLRFLDADTLEEKCQVIKSLEHSITDRLIDNFAVTLDLVIPDGRLDDRYQQLLSSVRTMQKFETSRFRK